MEITKAGRYAQMKYDLMDFGDVPEHRSFSRILWDAIKEAVVVSKKIEKPHDMKNHDARLFPRSQWVLELQFDDTSVLHVDGLLKRMQELEFKY